MDADWDWQAVEGVLSKDMATGVHPEVCLAVMTGPLYCRYSALTLIKYLTLPLQVSNVGDLEQATAFLS